MERLSVQDSSFFDVEAGGPPLAVGGVLTVAGQAMPISSCRELVASRLSKMAKLRQLVVPSRGLLQPKWVDADPDMSHHVTEIELPPGSSLENTVAKIMEQGFDADRPLWDIHIVRGYSDTEYAIVMRVHHAIADGQGTVLLLGNMLYLSPEGGMTLTEAAQAVIDTPDTKSAPKAESFREKVAHVKDAVAEPVVNAPVEYVRALSETIQTLNDMSLKRPSDLSGDVSNERAWVTGQFPLSRVKKAKSYYDCTVNDIVLAACASGFRDLLISRGSQIPDDRVVRAAMPISLRKSDDLSSHNQVSMLPINLLVGSDDPVVRLQAIKEKTAVAKKSMLPQLSDSLLTLTERTLPAQLLSWFMKTASQSSDWQLDTLITNIPGPPLPLYIVGDEVLTLVPIVPIASGTKTQIVIAVLSYNGSLGFAITGDGLRAKDIDVLLAGMMRELNQLADTAEQSA